MTATTPARRVITAAIPCPSWCEGHPADTPVHSRDLPGTWGNPSGPVLGLALEREDGERGNGEPKVNIQFSRDGVLVDSEVPLDPIVVEDFAMAMLRLAAAARAGR